MILYQAFVFPFDVDLNRKDYHLKNPVLKLRSNLFCKFDDDMISPNQKQPPELFRKKSRSSKFRSIHRKTPVLVSLFKKVADLT